MIVTKKRSFAKSMTWRFLAIIVTFVSIYALTGQGKLAGAGTVITNSINFVLYYIHERVWNNINWGKN